MRFQRLFVLKVFLFLCFNTYSQANITHDDLQKLNGEWSGIIEYTDYKDDKTRVVLNVNLSSKCIEDICNLNFEFLEPNGEKVYSKESIKINNKNSIIFDGLWKTTSFKQGQKGWDLIIEKNTKDNNKEALIQQHISIEEDNVSVLKLVQYANQNSFFQRSKLILSKQ